MWSFVNESEVDKRRISNNTKNKSMKKKQGMRGRASKRAREAEIGRMKEKEAGASLAVRKM